MYVIDCMYVNYLAYFRTWIYTSVRNRPVSDKEGIFKNCLAWDIFRFPSRPPLEPLDNKVN